MTPKRRFLAGILGGRVDRPPLGSVTSVTNVEQMDLTGAYLPEAHLDGEKMARLAAGAHEILGYDAIPPYFSVQAEAAALGCEVDWGDVENMPVERTHPWSEPEQVSIPDGFLQRPSTKAVLDAITILRHHYGHKVAIVGKVMGPWTLAYHMHGVQDFLAETILDPPKVRAFLDRLKEISVFFGRAQIEAGADVLCIADHATGDLVGPWTYRDFLLPVHKELTQRLGCPTVLHICGNTLDRMDHICEAGFDCFHFDSKVDARDAVRKIADRMSLIGNVNNPEYLLNGRPEQVAECTRYAVEAGVQVVGPECAIPLRTPLENLRAITSAVLGGL
jgi:[methyl-Co(III) methanol-specific corrinoid protein]:coenzyme M methyltransferase